MDLNGRGYCTGGIPKTLRDVFNSKEQKSFSLFKKGMFLIYPIFIHTLKHIIEG
jgi:hypothetical protein